MVNQRNTCAIVYFPYLDATNGLKVGIPADNLFSFGEQLALMEGSAAG